MYPVLWTAALVLLLLAGCGIQSKIDAMLRKGMQCQVEPLGDMLQPPIQVRIYDCVRVEQRRDGEWVRENRSASGTAR